MPIILPLTAPSAPGPTTGYTEWYRDVVTQCPGLQLDYALHRIRDAAIDFCTRTWAYKYDITGVMVADTPTYSLTPPAGTEITGIVLVKSQRSLTGDEMETPKVHARAAKTAAVAPSDVPTKQVMYRYDEVTFVPTPDGAYTFTVEVALRPTASSTDIDSDVFIKYRMGIAAGALYRLMSEPNKPWTNSAGAASNLTTYAQAVRDAKVEINREFAAEPMIVDFSMGSF